MVARRAAYLVASNTNSLISCESQRGLAKLQSKWTVKGVVRQEGQKKVVVAPAYSCLQTDNRVSIKELDNLKTALERAGAKRRKKSSALSIDEVLGRLRVTKKQVAFSPPTPLPLV